MSEQTLAPNVTDRLRTGNENVLARRIDSCGLSSETSEALIRLGPRVRQFFSHEEQFTHELVM
jgi:hypothetical protein